MATTRKAMTQWQGSLMQGSGQVTLDSSGLGTYDVTWPSRAEDPQGRTSPEELIAAAHAACFCMAFSNELSTRGHAPTRVEAEATATFEDGKVTVVVLDVRAEVPDLDEAGFDEALGAAEQSCPVSNALRGNVDIQVTGTLG